MSDSTPKPHIDLVREKLMDTLTSLCDRTNPMEIKRALAVRDVACALIDSARVENDYLKLSKQTQSAFLERKEEPSSTTRLPGPPGSGIEAVTRHLMGD